MEMAPIENFFHKKSLIKMQSEPEQFFLDKVTDFFVGCLRIFIVQEL